jgi:hypothetical protein
MAGLGLTLAKVGFNLIASLVTEAFLKNLIVHTLEVLVKKTTSDADDKILKDIAEAWKVK